MLDQNTPKLRLITGTRTCERMEGTSVLNKSHDSPPIRSNAMLLISSTFSNFGVNIPFALKSGPWTFTFGAKLSVGFGSVKVTDTVLPISGYQVIFFDCPC